MPKYFGSVQLVIEAPDEDTADIVQRRAAEMCQDTDDGTDGKGVVIEARCEERVEEDEYGHAG